MTSISQFFAPKYQAAKTYIINHKIISTIGLVILLFIGYQVHASLTGSSTSTRYVTATVGMDTIISTVTGTGQVSASNQVDLSPKASGEITYVGVTAGQHVSAGKTIAEIDPTTAEKAVRDAEISLQSAQISLDKLQEPATTLTLTQTQDALTQAQNDLQTSYTNGANTVSNTFLNLPSIMTGLQNILYGTDISKGQDNISAYNDLIVQYVATSTVMRDAVVAAYTQARSSYNQNFADYQAFSPASAASSTVDALTRETYKTTQDISASIKSINDYLNFIKDTLTLYNKNIPSALTSAQTNLSTYTGQINTNSANLLSDENDITSANYTIMEKTQSLDQLQSGADPLDVQSSQLSVTQRENALQDAKDTLSDYYVTAPFDGTVAKINDQVGDQAGSGTAVATLITTQQLAEISLNEVDIAKIKLGDKVDLTFDAINGLTITGTVAQIDSIGTVSQGVVTYDVKISFDTQDSRILPGMSVNASIITDAVPNVLVIPNSALKTQNGTHYVQVFNPPLPADTTGQGTASTVPPQNQTVTIGVANDTETQILSGLNEGDQIVTRTITSTAKTTTAAPSLLSATGVRSGAAVGGTGASAFRGAAGGATTGR